MFDDDNSAVWLGPGARWRDVYSVLEPYNLVVSGGRVADVGVGGYVLGGGFSWFANERGWTCDSVLAFETVVPTGEIITASRNEHPDLFWALKGSLGAFGVVTRIKVPTIEGTVVYAGGISYSESSVPRLLGALKDLADQTEDDLNTQGYISFGYLESYGTLGITAYLLNTRGDNSSATYRNFVDVPNRFVGLRRTTLRKSAEELDESSTLGLRRCKFALTTLCDVKTMLYVYDVVLQAIEDTEFESEAMLGATFQPLTVPHLQAQDNIFNLSSHEGSLLLVSIEVWWTSPSRDEYYEERMKTIHAELAQELDRRGTLHPFVYPNYAAKWQDPFAMLSAGTKARMENVKHMYDPDNVWPRLVPGNWHL